MTRLTQILILFALLGLSCQNDTNNLEESTHGSLKSDFYQEKVTVEQLPPTLKEGIKNNEIFSALTISNITKITENNFTYYDMTFKDVDGQLVMVFYDVNGEIINP